MANNKWENKNFFKSLRNSINGIFYVIKNGRNIKIQLVFAIFAIILSFILKLDAIEFVAIIIVIFLVLFAECMNTAIEKTVDLCTQEYNEIAKIAKDVSAGAVTVVAILSVIMGLIIFLPKIIYFLNL